MGDHDLPLRAAAPRALPPWTLAVLGLLTLYYCLLLSAGFRAGDWLVAPGGGPARMDFAEFWGAGRLALEGRPAAAYDWPTLQHRLETAMGAPWSGPPYPYFYPPTLLLLLAPLAALPTALGAGLWTAAGVGAASLGFGLARPRADAVLLLAAAPAAFFCVCVGQTALLTAGLLLLGLQLADRRPMAAGAAFALLAFKPQFGPLLLLCLAATGRWRPLAAGALVLAALIAISALVFGPETWAAFFRANAHLSALSTLPPEKAQSLYGLLRFLGADLPLAAGVHAAVAAGVVFGVVRLWRSSATWALKAAAVIVGTYLVTPYACIYDLALTDAAALLILPFAQRDRWTGALLILGCALPLLAFVRIAPYGAPSALLILASLTRALMAEGRGTAAPGALNPLLNRSFNISGPGWRRSRSPGALLRRCP